MTSLFAVSNYSSQQFKLAGCGECRNKKKNKYLKKQPVNRDGFRTMTQAEIDVIGSELSGDKSLLQGFINFS